MRALSLAEALLVLASHALGLHQGGTRGRTSDHGAATLLGTSSGQEKAMTTDGAVSFFASKIQTIAS